MTCRSPLSGLNLTSSEPSQQADNRVICDRVEYPAGADLSPCERSQVVAFFRFSQAKQIRQAQHLGTPLSPPIAERDVARAL